MDIMINGRRVYIFYPYEKTTVVEMVFSDGASFKVPSGLLKRMGYQLGNIPFGNQRTEG